MSCCREVRIANKLIVAGMSDLSIELLAASMPEPTDAQMRHAVEAAKPKAVSRYYDECMESSTAKKKGAKAASYCGAIAWSIYCKYKKSDSPHCKQGQYFTGKGAG
jgi:hypothetical protein